jgi:arginyl-tRNA synthetase
MISDQIRHIIIHTLQHLFEAGILSKSEIKLPVFSVELTKNSDHGDYATNVAMVLSKLTKQSPRQLAETIVHNLQDPAQAIQKAFVAGPGFINLIMTDRIIEQIIPSILKAGKRFGHHPSNGQSVLVEFVSANPTGPLHVGHARCAFMGDASARLLSAAGYQVTREFYVNDVGNQVKTLARTIYARYQELHGETIQLATNAYPGAYIVEIAKVLKKEDGDRWMHQPESAWFSRCLALGIAENLKNIREVLEQAGITFDSWYFEHQLHDDKKVSKIIEDYRAKGMLYDASKAKNTEEKVRREESKSAQYSHQQLGGTFLKTAQYGDEEDRILLKSNGDPVYLVADLAYHQEKYARGFDLLVDVFGADHAGHVPRIKAGMRALGLNDAKLHILSVQIVHLLKEGKEVRFSKRAGEIYLLEDLFAEVGVDVARFIFLMRSAHTQFDFDLDLALKQSNDNPVFYTQYGHARMATLLKRAIETKQPFIGVEQLHEIDLQNLCLPEERRMLMKMDLFPEVVMLAAKNLEPHRVIYFAQELISEFHSYFSKYRHSDRIISDDKALTQSRLALIAALKQTLYNALTLLNISAPEHMQSGGGEILGV